MPAKKTTAAHTTGTPLRLHGTIAQNLGVQIVSGRLQPGDLLSGEIDASDRLQVSRTAYREAVRILAAKGLVHSRPKIGTRISPQSQWHLLDPDVLSWIFQGNPPDALLDNLFELRKVVEPQAAALAARRRSPQHLQDMADALQRMAQHSLRSPAGRLADQDFHSAMLQATNNVFMISLTNGVSAAITWTTLFKQRLNSLGRDPLPDHQRVYDAIATSDEAAANTAMLKLIELAQQDVASARKPRSKTPTKQSSRKRRS